jgi:uncharacterized protein (DUF169 family)
MIITEYYKTREDGVVLNRTYSDAGMMIERDGDRYYEAIDPAELGRTYIETDEPIPVEVIEPIEEELIQDDD